jgi:hypothetical protein
MAGKKNLVLGFLFLGLFMAVGFGLGYMHDLAAGKADWIAQYAAGSHFEIRMAYAHGGLFGIVNVAIGLALMKLPLRAAGVISWLALGGLLMPLGIALHAAFGLPPVLVLAGGLSMILAALWTSWAAFRLR